MSLPTNKAKSSVRQFGSAYCIHSSFCLSTKIDPHAPGSWMEGLAYGTYARTSILHENYANVTELDQGRQGKAGKSIGQ